MKRRRKELSAQRKLTILFVGIVLLICGVLLFWTVAFKLPYKRYEKVIIDNFSQRNDFDYSIKSPDFLSTKGEIVIEKDVSDLEMQLTVEYNPFGNHRFYLYIKDKDYTETILIDADLNYIPQDYDNIELRKQKEKMLSKYHSQAKQIMQEAKNILEG